MSDRPTKLQKYFDNAVKAMASQDFDGAVAWFSALLDLSPLDEEALQLCEKSQVLLAQQKLNAAKKIGYQIWGNLGYSLGLFKSVVGMLGVLSVDKPQDPFLAAKYGKALMATKQPGLAAMAYRRALRFLTTNKTILKGAGEAFEAVDDKPGAIEVYINLAKLEPNNGLWPIKIKDLSAEHYGKTGGITDLKVARAEEEKKASQEQTSKGKEERIKELLDEYKKAPEEKSHLLSEMGRLLVQIKRYDQALAIWAKVKDNLHRRLAELQAPTEEEVAEEGENRRSKAIEEIESQLEEASFMVATSYKEKGDLVRAEEGFAALLEKHPTDIRYCDSVFDVRARALDRELEISPEDTGLLQERERLEKNLLARKVEIYRQLSEKRAGDPDTLLTYGDLLQQNGNLEEAIPVLQKVAQNPARAYQGLRRLGHLFLERGHIPLAIDSFQRALEKAPHSRSISNEMKDIWFGMGEAHMRQGDEDGARNWFKKVYETDIEFRDIRTRYESLL